MFFSKYPVNVLIFEERAGNMEVFKDKARRIRTREGEFYYQLKKMKIRTKPEKFGNLFSGGRSAWLFLYSPSPNQFFPMTLKPNNPNPQFTPLNEDLRLWMSMQTRKAYERFNKKTLWEKFMPIVIVAVTGIVITMILYVSVGKMVEMTGSMGSMASSLDHAASQMRAAMETIVSGRVQPVTPPP